jgi:general secretion pathway protein A
MYEQYYGFIETPFSLDPSPESFRLGHSQAEALAVLQHAFDRADDVVVISGEAGVGKTVLCRVWLEGMDLRTLGALLPSPFASGAGLLEAILRDVGVMSRTDGPAGNADEQALAGTFRRFLASLEPLGARAVLILDEAHDLPLPVLAAVERLVPAPSPLLRIVLAGEPPLVALLQSAELQRLERRIAARCRLEGWNDQEIVEYVTRRLALAQGSPQVAFTQKALQRLAACSGGTPRMVNLLADRTLAGACRARTARIDPAFVDAAAQSLGLIAPVQMRPSWLARLVRRLSP